MQPLRLKPTSLRINSRTLHISRLRALLTGALLLMILTGCQAGSPDKTAVPTPKRTQKEQCMVSGGQWLMFNNGCLDACEYRRGEVTICTAVRKLGCYCKGNKCWNGSRCEDV